MYKILRILIVKISWLTIFAGQKDGETKMAVDGNKKIFAYSWSNSEYKWTCLGEVTGSKEDKKMYKGEYTGCYKRVCVENFYSFILFLPSL